jgi:signal transduction histidine kinase
VLKVPMLGRRLAGVTGAREVPLLALRLPDLERTAWQRGRAAARRLERHAAATFIATAAAVLRGADVLGHDERSEIFLAALLDRAREGSTIPSPTDCRSALNRLAAALRNATGLRVEAGWTVITSLVGDPQLDAAVERALERGARERERYDFFSTVGHELRTPLTSVRGYLETLLDAPLDAATTHRFLEIAHAETLRVARLLDGMFEISLFDMRAMRRCDEESNVAQVIGRALDVLGPRARSRGVTALAQPCEVRALVGGDQLMQMLVNLIENAIKHGRADGSVVVWARAEDRRFARIFVDDDGPGIAPEERESIFALSHRGTTAAEGSGIGLAFVRLMAERVGGDVAVEESPLGGARFALRVPLA